MPSASRREFLAAGGLLGLGAGVASPPASAQGEAGPEPLPLIHVTDLFHPHGDPDDHFDLAVAYALTQRGCFDLRGVIIDYPPDFRAGDPAVVAVTQMNRLTARAVPVAIGTSRRLAHRRDTMPDAPPRETTAIRFLTDHLRASARPVALVCVGSAADIIVAALREPGLFAEKCAGVWLNSGSAHDNPADPTQLEFNVRLDPAAYAAMFDLPCPLHWFPCWDTTEQRRSGPAGSFYWLPHRDAFEGISEGLASYFAYMFGKSSDPKWLRTMRQGPDGALWAKILDGRRGMWSTASQLAAAGLTVAADGAILDAATAGDRAAFREVPVRVHCTEDGRTSWQKAEQTTGQWMPAVADPATYPTAMTRAVATLLQELR
ncbi:MAG: nucleoside hydrolase [Lentisphaeria bacterium]|nr:nucleoside hydrolase [Lentisphaeria bacterium]